MKREHKEWFLSLAHDHEVPTELAEQMAALMEQYPDLSQWGSKAGLKGDLKKIVESAFTNNLVSME